MKFILIITLTIVFAAGCKNHRGTTRTEEINENNKKIKINDDGNTMNMKVMIRNVENPVDYNRDFDVTNMSDAKKQTLKKHILDSLYKLNN